MNKKLLLAILPLAAAFASASADASRSYPHSGVGCVQADASANTLTRNRFGVYNTSTTNSITVECPVNISATISAQKLLTIAGVQAYDRNTASNVSCDLQTIDANGGVDYTLNFQTSGSQQTVQPLVKVLSTIQLSEGTWRMRCTIPPAVGGNNHVVSYNLITNE